MGNDDVERTTLRDLNEVWMPTVDDGQMNALESKGVSNKKAADGAIVDNIMVDSAPQIFLPSSSRDKLDNIHVKIVLTFLSCIGFTSRRNSSSNAPKFKVLQQRK